MSDNLESTIQTIPIDKIYVSKRMRKVIHSTADLEASIPVVGLLHPITVKLFEDDFYQYELIAGERRLVAHQRLKKDTIRANIATPEQAEKSEFIELIENEARESFTPLESVIETHMTHEKEVLKSIDSKRTHKIVDTARLFGKSSSFISSTLDAAKLYLDCVKYIESCTDKEKNDDPQFRWSMDLKTSCEKAKTRADIDRAVRSYNMTRNTQNLADAVEEKMRNLTIENPDLDSDDAIIIDKTEETAEKARPLWQRTIIERINNEYKTGDTFNFLKDFPDEMSGTCYWDIDPPFGINYDAYVEGSMYSDAKTFKEGCKFYKKVIYEMARISGEFSRAIIWHGAEPRYGTVVQNYLRKIGWKFDPIPFLWIKTKGHTRNRSINLPRCYEAATIAFAPKASFYESTFKSNWYECATPLAQERFHPNAKPYELVDYYFTRLFEFGSTAHYFIPFAGGGAAVYRALKFMPSSLYAADKELHYKNELIISVENGVFETPSNSGGENGLSDL